MESKPVGANQMERTLRWLECLTEPVLDLRRPTNRDAYRITLASCIVSVGFWATSFAMALAAADGSPALLSTVVESFIDAASSIFLLWRFSLGTPSTPQEERRDAFREHRATVALSISLIVLGAYVLIESAIEITVGEIPKFNKLGIESALSVPAGVVYLIVGMLQLTIGWSLDSSALAVDGWLSVFGSLISFGTLTGALLDVFLSSRTNADPWISVVVAIIMGGSGVRFLYPHVAHGQKWWLCECWSLPADWVPPPRSGRVAAPPAASEVTPLKSVATKFP